MSLIKDYANVTKLSTLYDAAKVWNGVRERNLFSAKLSVSVNSNFDQRLYCTEAQSNQRTLHVQQVQMTQEHWPSPACCFDML